MLTAVACAVGAFAFAAFAVFLAGRDWKIASRISLIACAAGITVSVWFAYDVALGSPRTKRDLRRDVVYVVAEDFSYAERQWALVYEEGDDPQELALVRLVEPVPAKRFVTREFRGADGVPRIQLISPPR